MKISSLDNPREMSSELEIYLPVGAREKNTVREDTGNVFKM